MNAEWQSDWARRLICALALWGWGMTSSGLVLFGVVAYSQGLHQGMQPILAMLTGSAGLVAWVALSRLNARREPARSVSTK
ncbi:hypothetical protein [Micropruina sp.]|uniref:hypothetical protein n=1 Tax=Micropruina sp. TaxID=2737536 RepID=UPI00261300E5|nr:hypothetical protein [Micropruina sp.]